MKIDPKKNYKKPLYALGLVTLVGTSVLCTACGPTLAGATTIAEPEETTTEIVESEITEEETN